MTNEPYILYIEDERSMIDLVYQALKLLGYKVVGAVSGKQGMGLIQQRLPDLLLLDLMMPGIDGFTIVEAMKADTILKEIPIVVITAKELSTIEWQRLNGKIKALLQKGSFMDDDLLNDIRQALP